MGAPIEITRDASFPPNTEHPVKPGKTTSLTSGGLIRCVRVVLDVYMEPGESEKLLLMEGETFEVSFRRKPQKTYGPSSQVGEPE